MNKAERLVEIDLRKKGFLPKKVESPGIPDFELTKDLFVEVKNSDYYVGKQLSCLQERGFSKLINEGKRVIIALVWHNKLIEYQTLNKRHKNNIGR